MSGTSDRHCCDCNKVLGAVSYLDCDGTHPRCPACFSKLYPNARTGTSDPAAEIEALKAEVAKYQRVFRHHFQPDLTGSGFDGCVKCGLDMRDKVHVHLGPGDREYDEMVKALTKRQEVQP